MEIQKQASSTFARKTDFLERKKVKIVDFYQRPNNFNEKRTDHVLTIEDGEGNINALEINNSNLNLLIDWFGNETDDWKGKKITIEAVDEGVKLVEGVERQCYSLAFAR